MSYLKILALACVIFALTSCVSRKYAVAVETPGDLNAIAGFVHSVAPQTLAENKKEIMPYGDPMPTAGKAVETLQTVNEKLASFNNNKVAVTASSKKAKSFSQMKEMVKNGDIVMSNKDQKTLNKLSKLYKGDFKQYKDNGFDLTTTAKIIAGVGIVALLISLFTGSWFFAFLFIVAALAFICRWIGIIEF
ncbi:MAG: hypothetical protein ABIX01_18655 [Chitinophagaceae bacterium]